MVKRRSTMQETRLRSLGRKDPLEKEMAATPVFWKIPWAGEPGGLWGRRGLDTQRVGAHTRIQVPPISESDDICPFGQAYFT